MHDRLHNPLILVTCAGGVEILMWPRARPFTRSLSQLRTGKGSGTRGQKQLLSWIFILCRDLVDRDYKVYYHTTEMFSYSMSLVSTTNYCYI